MRVRRTFMYISITFMTLIFSTCTRIYIHTTSTTSRIEETYARILLFSNAAGRVAVNFDLTNILSFPNIQFGYYIQKDMNALKYFYCQALAAEAEQHERCFTFK